MFAVVRVGVVAAGVVMFAAVSGCSGDVEKPSTLPPLTSLPSSSPDRQPAPAGVNAPTPQGATEFVRYFYAQVELAYQRKDPALVEVLSADGCLACQRFVASITRLRDEDQRTEGLLYDITSAAAPATDGTSARVDVIYNGPEVVRYGAGNQVVNREPPAVNVEEQVNLAQAPSGGWLVAEILRT